MRAIIIEDNKFMLEINKIIIEKNETLNVVGCFNNAYEVLEKIELLYPEVVFLGVEMTEISGIELAKKIQEFDSTIQIVFVSANEKYALEAFKVGVADYLIKPITEEDINISVKKLIKYKEGIRFFERDKNKNKISTLGNFEVYGNKDNKLIKWPTAKVEELFAYFVIGRGTSIDRWKLCELLWPKASPEKALHSLHSSVYRLKQTLKINNMDNVISYEKGNYKINISNMDCDIWKFEDFMMLNLSLNKENEYNYERIFKLYNGSLFQNKDYIWSSDLKEALDKFFLNTGKVLSKYYYNGKNYYKSEEVLRKIIKENSIDEDLIDLSMKIDFQLKNKIGIINTFKNLKNSLVEELDISPRRSTEKLYLELISNL